MIPHWSRSALVSVDVQNDFTLPGAPLEIPGTSKMLSGVAALLDAFRRRARPIVHVVRLYLEDGSNVDLCRRSMVFCGCNFPNCPRTSIYEASERDFRLVVASDAIAGICDLGIKELQNIGAAPLTVREIERLVFERG